MAASINDNEADKKSDKPKCQLIYIRCTGQTIESSRGDFFPTRCEGCVLQQQLFSLRTPAQSRNAIKGVPLMAFLLCADMSSVFSFFCE